MSYSPPGETSNQLFNEKTWLEGAIITSVAYGVNLTLFVMCFQVLYQQSRGKNNKRAIFFLLYISLMFLFGTLFVAAMAKMTQLSFIDDRNFPGGPAAFETLEFSIPVDELGNVMFVLANWFADALLVWRCIVIYKTCGLSIWIVMLFPCLLYGASFAMGVMFLIQISAPASSPWASSTINFTLPYLSLSLALNIIITIAIALRLFVYRRRISRTLGSAYGSQYISIAAMIIESASLYSAFSLFFLIPFGLNNAIQNTALQLLSQIEIIAPLLIIFRVAQGKAWSNGTADELLSTHRSAHSSRMGAIRMTTTVVTSHDSSIKTPTLLTSRENLQDKAISFTGSAAEE